MNRFIRHLLAVLLAGNSALLQAAPITLTDDTGQVLQLAAPAQRIVSLAPHITELLFAAGAGKQVVGVVDYSNYPEAARTIRRVGGYSKLDMEAVAALKPDLVLAWQSGNAAAHLERLRKLGLPVFVSQPDRIEDIARNLEHYGRLAGTDTAAGTAARRFRERLEQLRARFQQRPGVSVFYQVWKGPLTTVNGRQIISDVIGLCGGVNVFAKLPALAPVVSVEAVLAANPEAIVASGMDEQRPEWLDDWKRWERITAVAQGNLFFIPPDLIQRHTPRLLDGAEQLCAHLETVRSRRGK